MLARTALLLSLALGCLTGLVGAAPEEPKPTVPPEGRGVPIMGRIIWPGHDLTNTVVRVYTDPEFKKLVGTFPTGGPRGGIVFTLSPGTYYLMVFSDQDGDKRPSPGDGLGFYGVTDTTTRPRPLVVDPGAGVITLALPISLKFAADGKHLEPVEVHAPAPYAAEKETPISGTVAGIVEGGGEVFVLLSPLGPGFPARACVVGKDAKFELTAVPGAYLLLAVQDLNGSHTVDCGDLVGLADYEEAMGVTIPITRVEPGKELRGVTLELAWALDRHGRLRSGDGELLGPRLDVASLPAVCAGVVTRFGQSVPRALVRAYADESLRDLQIATRCDDAGRFCFGAVGASYYVTTLHDVKGNGALGPGDELGFVGLTEASPGARPRPLSLHPGDLRSDLTIPLTMVIDDQTHPQPLVKSAEAEPPKSPATGPPKTGS